MLGNIWIRSHFYRYSVTCWTNTDCWVPLVLCRRYLGHLREYWDIAKFFTLAECTSEEAQYTQIVIIIMFFNCISRKRKLRMWMFHHVLLCLLQEFKDNKGHVILLRQQILNTLSQCCGLNLQIKNKETVTGATRHKN